MPRQVTPRYKLPSPADNDALSAGARAIFDLATKVDAALYSVLGDAKKAANDIKKIAEGYTNRKLKNNFGHEQIFIRSGTTVTKHLGFGQVKVPFPAGQFVWPPIVVACNGDYMSTHVNVAVSGPGTVTKDHFYATVTPVPGGTKYPTNIGALYRINWIAFGVGPY